MIIIAMASNLRAMASNLTAICAAHSDLKTFSSQEPFLVGARFRRNNTRLVASFVHSAVKEIVGEQEGQ